MSVIKSRKRHIFFYIHSIEADVIDVISISSLCFCRRHRNALGPVDPGSNYSVIIRSNSRGFALESIHASRRQTGRHFEGQLNLVERPTTAVPLRTRIRTVDALMRWCHCQLSIVNRLPIMWKPANLLIFLLFFFLFLFISLLPDWDTFSFLRPEYIFIYYTCFFFYFALFRDFPFFFQTFARFQVETKIIISTSSDIDVRDKEK